MTAQGPASILLSLKRTHVQVSGHGNDVGGGIIGNINGGQRQQWEENLPSKDVRC